MKRRAFSALIPSCLLFLGALSPLTPVASAQGQFALQGNYAVQFTGTVFLPPPFDKYNGPFSRNGITYFDGLGNFYAKVVANYNGNITRDTYSGTYVVNGDGTFTITIQNLPIPALPANVPNTFSFDGVIANNGTQAKLTLSGVSVGGQPQANIGSVIVGELIKQYHQ